MRLKSRASFIGLAIGGMCVLLGLFHRHVLTLMVAPLVVAQADGSADVALIGGGDRCYEAVVEQFQIGRHDKVLVFRSGRSRLTDLGILPPGDELARQQLVAQGVPMQSLIVLDPMVEDRRDPLVAFRHWLEAHPDLRIAVYCDQFSSRRVRWNHNRDLGVKLASRTEIIGLPDRRYGQTNWWKSKAGIKAFCNQWFLLCYDSIRGKEPPAKAVLSPDEYEARVFK